MNRRRRGSAYSTCVTSVTVSEVQRGCEIDVKVRCLYMYEGSVGVRQGRQSQRRHVSGCQRASLGLAGRQLVQRPHEASAASNGQAEPGSEPDSAATSRAYQVVGPAKVDEGADFSLSTRHRSACTL